MLSDCRGGAAISGLAGAYFFPILTGWYGLWVTGQMSIVYQWFMVSVSVVALILCEEWFPAWSHLSAILLAIAVVLSRSGLWCFDLCVRQIAQESIAEHMRGRVNGEWKSLIAFCDMSIYVVAMVFAGQCSFLCKISCGEQRLQIHTTLSCWLSSLP